MASKLRSSPYREQLKAYQSSWKTSEEDESWKANHEELKRRLWAFEDKLQIGLSLFDAISTGYWNWRTRLRTQQEKFLPEDEALWREAWEWWLIPCDQVTNQLIELEGMYGRGEVDGASQFRRHCEYARDLLRNWARPDGSERHVRADTSCQLTGEQVKEGLAQQTKPAMPSVPLKHPIDRTHVF